MNSYSKRINSTSLRSFEFKKINILKTTFRNKKKKEKCFFMVKLNRLTPKLFEKTKKSKSESIKKNKKKIVYNQKKKLVNFEKINKKKYSVVKKNFIINKNVFKVKKLSYINNKNLKIDNNKPSFLKSLKKNFISIENKIKKNKNEYKKNNFFLSKKFSKGIFKKKNNKIN